MKYKELGVGGREVGDRGGGGRGKQRKESSTLRAQKGSKNEHIKKSTFYKNGRQLTVLEMTNLRPLDSGSNWKFRNLFSFKGGKPELPTKNSRSTDKILNSNMEALPYLWVANVLATAHA